ncbi:MAG: tyrosine--tRNA ligase [Victivallaceae bacterium]|nr:tyrosine--tRNA ligase [Victivallaceae bacterium]
MSVFQELQRRQFIYQATDAEAIEKLLATEKVTFYVGFDPTGNSLHVGHLLPIMAMRFLQQAGHVPIVLVGGATARIGDPSGRISARPILTVEEIDHNVECLKKQLSRFISVEAGACHFVNNADWLCKLNYIDFLRDIGPKFSVNRMIAQDSVKQRLENGLSFLEFNYSILQAYDFYHLNATLGCRMEFGGQDQWGNMVAGVDLVRKMNQNEVFALTFPLLLDSNGKKFGKTAGGNNVWLDTERTNVFDYYQFWRNCEDQQLEKLMLTFTPLPVEEVKRLSSAAAASELNRAKEILAFEATKMAHGATAAAEAYLTAGNKFGFADPENRIATTSEIVKLSTQSAPSALPTVELDKALFANDGLWVVKLFVEAGLAASNGEARRLIQGGGAYMNDVKIASCELNVKSEDFSDGALIVKAGRKNIKKVILK